MSAILVFEKWWNTAYQSSPGPEIFGLTGILRIAKKNPTQKPPLQAVCDFVHPFFNLFLQFFLQGSLIRSLRNIGT